MYLDYKKLKCYYLATMSRQLFRYDFWYDVVILD